MEAIQIYKEYFSPEETPEALAKLIHFDAGRRGWFSQGFELEVDPEDRMLKSHSENLEFLDSLFAMGQADSTGSIYYIWRQNGALNDVPVVALGGEGGAHIVASNLVELLRILTLDAEPMISWDEITYYKPEDAEPSEGAADFVAWLIETFKVQPVKDASEVRKIVDDARIKHEKKFQEWLNRFSR